MTAYLIIDAKEVTDPELMKQYGAAVNPMLDAYGAETFTASSAAEVLEGDWTPGRIIMISFADMKTLKGFYGSDEYAEMITLRKRAARANLIAVDGIGDTSGLNAFVIAEVTGVTNPAALEEYQKDTPATIAKHGGRPFVLSGDAELLEGDWSPKWIVMIGFPDMDALHAWYESPEYKRLIEIRQAASSTNIISVLGL